MEFDLPHHYLVLGTIPPSFVSIRDRAPVALPNGVLYPTILAIPGPRDQLCPNELRVLLITFVCCVSALCPILGHFLAGWVVLLGLPPGIGIAYSRFDFLLDCRAL